MWVEWVDRAGDGWDCWVSLKVKGRVVSREIHLKLGIKRGDTINFDTDR